MLQATNLQDTVYQTTFHSALFNSLALAVEQDDRKTIDNYFYGRSNIKNSLFKENGVSLLHLAATNRTPAMVELLVGLGAKVNTKSSTDDTPLTWACLHDRVDNVTVLVKLGADVNAAGQIHGPLHAAIKRGHKKIVDYLLQQQEIDVNKQTIQARSTALHVAVNSGNVNMVETLLRAHAKTEVPDGDGRLPLTSACCAGRLDIMQKLLEHQADVNAKNDSTAKPMHLAVTSNRADIVDYLLQQPNIDVNLQTVDTRQTPLHIACRKNKANASIITMLLQAGAKNDVIDRFDHTPDQLTVNNEIKQLVCAHNATPPVDHSKPVLLEDSIGNKVEGKTPNIKTASSIVDHGLKQSRTIDVHDLEKLILANDSQRLRNYFGNNLIDVRIKGESGMGKKLLHLAAENSNSDIVDILLAAGQKVNAIDRANNTPLTLASYGGKLDNVKILIANGADVNQSSKYKGPLQAAVMGNHTEVLNYLLEQTNTNVDAMSILTQQTALHIACNCENFEIAKILLEKGANTEVKDVVGKKPIAYTRTTKIKELLGCKVFNLKYLYINDKLYNKLIDKLAKQRL